LVSSTRCSELAGGGETATSLGPLSLAIASARVTVAVGAMREEGWIEGFSFLHSPILLLM